MGKINHLKSILIADGLYLKILDNGIYHYYFRLAGFEFRKSTKTKDKLKATQIAIADFKLAHQKMESGFEVKTLSFKYISQQYLQSFKNEARNKYHSDTVKRHILPFFTKFDDVSKIKMTDLDDYKNYRLKKNPNVTPQTLNRENTVLNMLFRYASEREWVRKNIKVLHLPEQMTRKRRGYFSIEENIQLMKTSQNRIFELNPKNLKGQNKGLFANKLYQRQLLHDIMLIISNTGMRVSEINNLRWRDVDFDKSQIRLAGIGKVNSYRTISVPPNGLLSLTSIKQRRLDYLNSKQETLDTNELIQSLPNGKFVKSLKKGFNMLLVDAGFKYVEKQDKHTLTSFRHFFATSRLTSTVGKRATIQGLAKQMGTSVRMIEKYYGHDVATDYADEMAG